MEKLRATVTIEDVPDGVTVSIEYSDGHAVFMMLADPESIVLRRHLGLDDDDEDALVPTPE